MDPVQKEFLEQLTPFQKIAHKIAVKNLESSFSLEKCIGYLEYKQEKEKEKKASTPPS
jgi:hypothetical protein